MKPYYRLLALTFVLLPEPNLQADQAPRPNILYFYVDDMGWGSIGPNGQQARREANLPSVKTPNLDRLAAQGVNFTRGYGCPVCSPARSSLQTGFHQGHTYADRNDPNNARKAIRKDDISIGTSLAGAGYVTGYWGKWGYGGSKDQNNPTIDNVQTLPTSHGFQHVLAELHHVRAHTFFQPTLWQAPAPEGALGGLHLILNSMEGYRDGDRYPALPARQSHPEYPRTAYCDDCYAFAALDFVREQGHNYRKTGQPFIGVLAVQIPHAPFAEVSTLPEWDAAYRNDPHFESLADQSRQWAAMVTRIDAHFGNLLAALEDPNHDGDTSDSIADKTLVIFQSDNGGPGGKNNIELDANGGLSGVKGSVQEGGIRVPLVMRWPERIHSESKLKAGTSTNMVVDVTDLLPTFCELAGVDAPVGIDGVSIAPTLTGEGHQRTRDFLIHEAGSAQSIIKGNLKLFRSRRKGSKLFDLEKDPQEENDIAADHPEVVQQLEKLLVAEQALQPKGFANSYHHWQGADGALASDAENWSDYEYSNAGIIYITADGPPDSSWIAHLTNNQDTNNTAVVEHSLSLLGVSLSGNSKTGTRQSVLINTAGHLTGRNEVRIGQNGTVQLDGGTVSSLRWVDVKPGGILQGQGVVQADVENRGTVCFSGSAERSIRIAGDFRQTADGQLIFQTVPAPAGIQVDGTAWLNGSLTLPFTEGAQPAVGNPVTLVRARNVSGKFQTNTDDVVTSNGVMYRLRYSDTEVTATRLAKPQ